MPMQTSEPDHNCCIHFYCKKACAHSFITPVKMSSQHVLCNQPQETNMQTQDNLNMCKEGRFESVQGGSIHEARASGVIVRDTYTAMASCLFFHVHCDSTACWSTNMTSCSLVALMQQTRGRFVQKQHMRCELKKTCSATQLTIGQES